MEKICKNCELFDKEIVKDKNKGYCTHGACYGVRDDEHKCTIAKCSNKSTDSSSEEDNKN